VSVSRFDSISHSSEPSPPKKLNLKENKNMDTSLSRRWSFSMTDRLSWGRCCCCCCVSWKQSFFIHVRNKIIAVSEYRSVHSTRMVENLNLSPMVKLYSYSYCLFHIHLRISSVWMMDTIRSDTCVGWADG
jgi:hypothetical protein